MTGKVAAIDPQFAGLSEEDRQLLESWLVEFDRSWNKDRLAAWVRKLPPPGDSLRRLALVEMVKVDMERRWQQGQRTRLESYLKALPELGTPETVAPDLIQAEYEIMAQLGAPASLAEFARRFPRQIEQVQYLLELARESGSASQGARRSPETAAPRPSTIPPVASPQAVPSGVLEELGRYQIIKRLGQGGMGSVYLARDTQLDRLVALKIPHFKPEDGPEPLHRFYREARAAATIEHPNLCRIYDVGAVDGIQYLTMEYIEGKPMSELLKNGKPLTQRQIAAFVRKLALALQDAHRRGVVHRDLKPANIMINQRREPVIVDFGLARRFDIKETLLTQPGAIMGTPAYMSPEQVDGALGELCAGCDIYSLGVILYELLAGQRPFQGTLYEMLAKVLYQEPTPPSVYRPDLDPELEAICLKAMAKKVEDRYATMEKFAAALSDFAKPPQPPASNGHGTRRATAPEVDEAAPVNRVFAKTDVEEELERIRPQKANPSGGASRVPSSRVRAIATTSAALVLLLLGVVIHRIATDKGELVIESDDPDIKVMVSRGGESVTIIDPKTDRGVQLRSGEYRIELKGDAEGLRHSTDRFTLTRGGRAIVNVRREGRSGTSDAVLSADIVDVTPDPRTTSVNSVTIAFGKAVTGFDMADLRLTRAGVIVQLGGATLTTQDNITWTLSNLSTVTEASATYEIRLVAADSGVTATGGNPLAGDAWDTFTVDSGFAFAGRETRVNTATQGQQLSPMVARDADGDAVVIWETVDANGTGMGIYAQRYDKEGSPVGGVIDVLKHASNIQGYKLEPRLAMDSVGNFVVVWHGGGPGDIDGIFGQRFDASDTKIGGVFRLNTREDGNQGEPSIAMAPDGKFVVTWSSWSQDTDVWDVFARRYGTSGDPLDAAEFRVNQYTAGNQFQSAASMAADGSFLVAYFSMGQDGDGGGVYARRYRADGTPIGTQEFQVNETTAGTQNIESAAMEADGGFVITWIAADGSGNGVYARWYDAAGSPLGSETPINTTVFGQQIGGFVAANAQGESVITWISQGQDGDLDGVFARRFDAQGRPLSGEFRVNTTVTGRQGNLGDCYQMPRLALDSNGSFTIVWTGNGPGDSDGIFAQRFVTARGRPGEPNGP